MLPGGVVCAAGLSVCSVGGGGGEAGFAAGVGGSREERAVGENVSLWGEDGVVRIEGWGGGALY